MPATARPVTTSRPTDPSRPDQGKAAPSHQNGTHPLHYLRTESRCCRTGHIDKLNFYVNVVDDQLHQPEHGDRPTIGILLAADRDDVAVQYYLQGLTTPLAVSTYRSLPDEVRPSLPSSEALADLVRTTQREIATESAASPGH